MSIIPDIWKKASRICLKRANTARKGQLEGENAKGLPVHGTNDLQGLSWAITPKLIQFPAIVLQYIYRFAMGAISHFTLSFEDHSMVIFS